MTFREWLQLERVNSTAVKKARLLGERTGWFKTTAWNNYRAMDFKYHLYKSELYTPPLLRIVEEANEEYKQELLANFEFEFDLIDMENQAQ
jgi:hypothetical protein